MVGLRGVELNQNPYKLLPSYTRWSRSVANLSYNDVDPVVNFSIKICKQSKIATAGSCFAQHISRYLQNEGFNYFVVEDGHPLGNQEDKQVFNYGTFSARYGNIYTTRQLLQLFQRAFGKVTPNEDYWVGASGTLIDPFRPVIQPCGFASLDELHSDRDIHLGSVRKMFEELDVFIFTLGLTEAWCSRFDGSVFPVCPGVAGGTYTEDRYAFVNFNVVECFNDLLLFIHELRCVNKNSKVILTVSPVPLVATAENRHVLHSTTYSKSVLRVICEELSRGIEDVAYFPSYEIIAGNYNRGKYFAEDLRSVTEEGVQHVMRLFLKHTAGISSIGGSLPYAQSSRETSFLHEMQQIVHTICEEELIERSLV